MRPTVSGVRAADPYRVQRWVGGRVAERRRTFGLTQEALAERLEVSLKYLQRVEAGQENLTIRSVVGLANALEVEPSYLIKPPRNPRRAKPGRPPSKPARKRTAKP